MNIIKESDFRKEIKASPAHAYLFFGEEDYLKSFALQSAIDAISPDETFSMFNILKFDALTYSPEGLADALMPAPMMSERKLIIISGLDFNATKASDIEALTNTLAMLDEYDYNTVIINTSSDRFDWGDLTRKKPSRLLTNLSEFATPVYFEKISPSRLVSWVGKHYTHNGVSASPEICSLTIERCGRDMYNLSSETDKISYYVKSQGRDTVSAEDVLKISVSVEEFDTFAFSNAITAGERDRALAVLYDMKFRRVDPIIVMSEIVTNICDSLSVELLANDGMTSREIAEFLGMNEYRATLILRSKRGVDRLKAILEKCREADLRIKGMSVDGYSVIEKLICTIP